MQNNKMNILNRCFTKNWLNNCIENNYDVYYNEIIKRYVINYNKMTNHEVVHYIYNLMSKKYRNEYYYKNSILNSLIIERHNPKTTIALSEFQISKSLADFLLINGKCSVYEIKTELDNLERLENQIDDYYKAFSFVSIVTYSDNYVNLSNILMKYPSLGVYILKRKKIYELKKPLEYDFKLDKIEMFRMLRKNEFEEVITNLGKELPQVNQFEFYSKCKEIFISFDVKKIQNEIVKILKKRINVNPFLLLNTPYELRFLTYSMNFDTQNSINLKKFLDNKCEVRN